MHKVLCAEGAQQHLHFRSTGEVLDGRVNVVHFDFWFVTSQKRCNAAVRVHRAEPRNKVGMLGGESDKLRFFTQRLHAT